jgi:hypothetical protein
MCSWRFLYNSEFALENDLLLIRFDISENRRDNEHKHKAYMFPLGDGDLVHAIQLLEEDALQHGHPLCMLGVTEIGKNALEKAMPNTFHFMPQRDYFDYVYLHSDLSQLTGKKYQPKRNHVNKFRKTYHYDYLPIIPAIVPHCLDLENQWYDNNKNHADPQSLAYEKQSMTFALHHFEALGLIGGAISVDDRIVAFSYGSPINHNTFGIHVEKADVNFDGVFSAINQEFAQHIPEQYVYINREEDLGLPGLRQAKLSYHPHILLEKNTALKRH